MHRKVEINLSDSMVDANTKPEFMKTLAYLVMWGNAEKVVILANRYDEIIAHYYVSVGETGGLHSQLEYSNYFTIGAILDETTGSYSTHS